MLAAIAEIQGDPSGAIGQLRKAVELGETLPFARRRLAVLLAASGRLDEAAPVIASLGDAGGPVIDRIRAQLLAAAGRTEQALSIAAALTPEECRDAQQLNWYARLLSACGKHEEAEQVGRRATDAAPDDAGAWLTLVRIQSSAGAADRAAETVSLALEKLQGASREQFELAADDTIGDPAETERVFREAVEKSPDDLVAARRLVDLLTRRGNTAEAREQLRRIIALESAKGTPTLAWARRALATSLAASPRYDDLQEAIGILARNVDQQGVQYVDDLTLSISLLIGRNSPASWRQAQTTPPDRRRARQPGADPGTRGESDQGP
jgi:Flp pilus assembly protein TadD